MRRREQPTGLSRASGLWWLHPAVLAAALPLGTLLLSQAFTDADFRRLWRSPKVITDAEFHPLLIGAMLLILGATLATALMPVRKGPVYTWFSPRELALLRRASSIFFWLTMLGYLAFLVQAARAHVTLNDLLLSAAGEEPPAGLLEERIKTIPGVSTLTQLGVAFGVTGTIVRRCHPDENVRRRITLGLAAVFFWAFVRAIALTERLAILEILVPMIAVSVMMAVPGTRSHRRVQLLPVALGPLVVGIFALFEHSRSWQWYSTHGSTNFWRFILDRFAGYYVTAVNNAAMRMQHQERGVLPYDTLEVVWRAPGVAQARLYEKFTGLEPGQGYPENLFHYTTIEFNNPSGLGNPFVDYSTPAAWTYLFLMGAVTGVLYALYRRRSPFGVFIYPLAFVTLLEMPRYLWWAQGRSLPPLAALLLLAAIMTVRRARPNRSETPQP